MLMGSWSQTLRSAVDCPTNSLLTVVYAKRPINPCFRFEVIKEYYKNGFPRSRVDQGQMLSNSFIVADAQAWSSLVEGEYISSLGRYGTV